MIEREFECHHIIVTLVIDVVGVKFPSRRRRLEREEFGWHFPVFLGRESVEKEGGCESSTVSYAVVRIEILALMV